MYRKILVANDGSPGALKALAAAIALTKRDSAALHMVTVRSSRGFLRASTKSRRKRPKRIIGSHP
jgi:nucleotide-binding universal stress UspA family protein